MKSIFIQVGCIDLMFQIQVLVEKGSEDIGHENGVRGFDEVGCNSSPARMRLGELTKITETENVPEAFVL
jgi:hypothetical protein